MRTRAALLLIGILGAGALMACGSDGRASGATSDSVAAQRATTTDGPTITAQGIGKVTGVPDVLSVSFNVHTQGSSANDTLHDNNAATQQVLDAAHAAGVKDDDIKTTNVSINPMYDYANQRPRLTGYAADNSFVVKLRDASTEGSTIDALSAAGGDAVQIQGIAYSFDDDTSLLQQARADAVQRASAQAKQLADAAGVHLGAVRSITEVPPQQAVTYGYAAAGAGGQADSASVPVQAGTQQLTLTVEVVYDIA